MLVKKMKKNVGKTTNYTTDYTNFTDFPKALQGL